MTLTTLMLLSIAIAGAAPAGDDLRQGFVSPPESARMWVWWMWLDNRVTPRELPAILSR